jgi:MGT family glycosyltransferase
MSRVLVASYSIMGHYRPCVRVIQELVAAGHDVLYVSESPVPAARALGCKVATLGLPRAPVPTGEEKARMVSDPEAVLNWQKWVRVGSVETMIDPFREIIRQFRPHVVAADAQMYSAFLAAHREGVRSTSIFTSLSPFMHWLATAVRDEAIRVAPDRAAMFASHGMNPEFRIWELLSPTLNVSFTTRALVGPDADVPPHTLLAGPSIPHEPDAAGEFPWDRLARDRPIVYVSFGSMNFWQPKLIRIVAEAAAPLGVQVVISCSALADTEHVVGLPGDPLIARFVPQPALLERTAVFVSHAGAGSIMDACYSGVPVLAVPITSDQPATAHLIARIAKIGHMIAPSELEVVSCRDALIALLADPSDIRTRLASVKASFRAHDGGKVTADALAQIAAS